MKKGTVKHTKISYFTRIAKDEDENPTEAPPPLPESHVDVRRFPEAVKRKALRTSYAAYFDNAKTEILHDEHLEKLARERCQLADGLTL